MDRSKSLESGVGASQQQVMRSLEDLDATLQQLSYGRAPIGGAATTPPEREGEGTPTEDRSQTDPRVPSSTARLVGDEVATILDAAEVAADRIRARAWEVAAEVQRQIRDMQGTLARLALEMSDLMRTGDGKVPDQVEPTQDELDTDVGLAVLLDDREEGPSEIGPVRPSGSV